MALANTRFFRFRVNKLASRILFIERGHNVTRIGVFFYHRIQLPKVITEPICLIFFLYEHNERAPRALG